LRSLQPHEWDVQKSHQDIAAHLRGFDADAFAVELARLSLLLHALPAGNGWDVRQADVLTTRLKADQRPNLIVANPPWGNSNRIGGKRREAADVFLDWMIRSLNPDGFLAIVLPVGWLNSRGSREARDSLRRRCDLFEVWRLPEATFENARMAPAVLFAQKKRASGSTIHFNWLHKRVVRPGALEHFYATGEPEYRQLVADEHQQDGPLLSGALTNFFRGRDSGPSVDFYAKAVTGPQPRPGIVDRRGEPETTWYLRNAGSVKAFRGVEDGQLVKVKFPDDFQNGSARGAEGRGRRKIIVSAARWAENPWRLKPFVDDLGVLVRNSLHMVLPHVDDDDHIFGLLAFFGSAFASAWIDEHVSDRNISTADIHSMPAPPEDSAWKDLAEFGRKLHSSDNVADVGPSLDEHVWRLMGVPESVAAEVVDTLRGFNAPEGVARYRRDEVLPAPADPVDGRRRRRFGSTLEIEDGKLLIRIPGVTSELGDWCRPPLGMTGWMARPGATYSVLIQSGESLWDAQFVYQSAAWLNEEELLDVTSKLHGDDGSAEVS
jgi:hypothetical protein